MKELTGMVAIVTGSSSGIGETTAQRLSALGATVVVNSSSSVEAGQKISAALPGDSIYVQADISDKAQGESLIQKTLDAFGKIDLLVNNAGWTTVVPHNDLEALTDEIFLKTFEVNVFGTWWLTKRQCRISRNQMMDMSSTSPLWLVSDRLVRLLHIQ